MLLAPAVSPREPALAEGTGANNPAIRLFKFNPNSGQVHSSAAAIVACLTTQLSPSSTYTRMPIDPTFGGSSERRAGGNEIGTGGGGAEGAEGDGIIIHQLFHQLPGPDREMFAYTYVVPRPSVTYSIKAGGTPLLLSPPLRSSSQINKK